MGVINIPKTDRFRFKLPKKFYGRKLHEIKKEIDELQPLTETGKGEVWRDPILTNYGCACFHFSYDEDKLLEYYGNYISEELKEKVEEKLGELLLIESALWQTLEEDDCREVLDKILMDHPDVMSYGLIQIVLATIPLKVEYNGYPIENTIQSLNRNLEVMKKIAELYEKFDTGLDYEYALLDNETDEEKRLTIYINDFDFDPDETLEEVENRIDGVISPLKNYLERKALTDQLLYP